jgi:hypothetical protein
MFQTKIGLFDGKSWEEFCQQCFRLKYENEGYQFMPDINGDYGIEGFTRAGIVFQCYCPNNNTDSNTLYEAQRDKITTDLQKLARYKEPLKKYFKDCKIKTWIFVTPEYRRKELVKHCRDKAEEYRNFKLDILDPNFDVLIHDLGNFTREIQFVLNYLNKELEIIPEQDSSNHENKLQWKNTQISLVDNANRKNKLLVGEMAQNLEQKVDKRTNITISNKLEGDSIINTWKVSYPDDYERFLRIVSIIENDVIETCTISTDDNNQRYKDFQILVYDRLKVTFPNLSESMLLSLRNKVMSDWILNCPIDFE